MDFILYTYIFFPNFRHPLPVSLSLSHNHVIVAILKQMLYIKEIFFEKIFPFIKKKEKEFLFFLLIRTNYIYGSKNNSINIYT